MFPPSSQFTIASLILLPALALGQTNSPLPPSQLSTCVAQPQPQGPGIPFANATLIASNTSVLISTSTAASPMTCLWASNTTEAVPLDLSGGQQLYVASDGALRYTSGNGSSSSAALPAGAIRDAFDYVPWNGTFTKDEGAGAPSALWTGQMGEIKPAGVVRRVLGGTPDVDGFVACPVGGDGSGSGNGNGTAAMWQVYAGGNATAQGTGCVGFRARTRGVEST